MSEKERYVKCVQKENKLYGRVLSDDNTTLCVAPFNKCGVFCTLQKKDWDIIELRTIEDIDKKVNKLLEVLLEQSKGE